MNLEDALGSAEGNSQSAGVWGDSGGNNASTGAWPVPGGYNPSPAPWSSPGGQPTVPNPPWPGAQGSGGGIWPGPPGPLPGPGPAVVPQQNLTVPFSRDLTNGVYDKLLITIAGSIKPNPNKIVVDLYADKDLAFHFNPRFNENGKKVIVRNSRIRNQWGREERECPGFPFAAGQPFEMKILCTNQEFKVAVNGSHLLAYKHRFSDLRSIKRLCIYNDLTLSKVNMESLP